MFAVFLIVEIVQTINSIEIRAEEKNLAKKTQFWENIILCDLQFLLCEYKNYLL